MTAHDTRAETHGTGRMTPRNPSAVRTREDVERELAAMPAEEARLNAALEESGGAAGSPMESFYERWDALESELDTLPPTPSPALPTDPCATDVRVEVLADWLQSIANHWKGANSGIYTIRAMCLEMARELTKDFPTLAPASDAPATPVQSQAIDWSYTDFCNVVPRDDINPHGQSFREGFQRGAAWSRAQPASDAAWPKPSAKDSSWTICPDFLEQVMKRAATRWPSETYQLEETEALLVAAGFVLRSSPPSQPVGEADTTRCPTTLCERDDGKCCTDVGWCAIEKGFAKRDPARVAMRATPQPSPDTQPTDAAQSGGEPVAWQLPTQTRVIIERERAGLFATVPTSARSDRLRELDRELFNYLGYHLALDDRAALYATPPRPADTASADYAWGRPSAIDRDDADPTREYIPLPCGWEIQTKGRGSSYRLLDRKTGERFSICSADATFIHDFVTRMAREINTASRALAPVPNGGRS